MDKQDNGTEDKKPTTGSNDNASPQGGNDKPEVKPSASGSDKPSYTPPHADKPSTGGDGDKKGKSPKSNYTGPIIIAIIIIVIIIIWYLA